MYFSYLLATLVFPVSSDFVNMQLEFPPCSGISEIINNYLIVFILSSHYYGNVKYLLNKKKILSLIFPKTVAYNTYSNSGKHL